MACARVHRPSGEWRRRRAVQRSADGEWPSHHRRGSQKIRTTGLLPTLITDSPEKMRLAMEAVNEIADREPSVLGIHLEGPFISPEKPGVHDISHIRPVAAADMAMLTVPRRVPCWLPWRRNAFRRVGSPASLLPHPCITWPFDGNLQQTGAFMEEGLNAFTHLFNAMPALSSRSPDRSPKHWRPPMSMD